VSLFDLQLLIFIFLPSIGDAKQTMISYQTSKRKYKRIMREAKAMEKAECAFGERKLITLDFNVCLITNLE